MGGLYVLIGICSFIIGSHTIETLEEIKYNKEEKWWYIILYHIAYTMVYITFSVILIDTYIY